MCAIDRATVYDPCVEECELITSITNRVAGILPRVRYLHRLMVMTFYLLSDDGLQCCEEAEVRNMDSQGNSHMADISGERQEGARGHLDLSGCDDTCIVILNKLLPIQMRARELLAAIPL
jgi:hypothetical protein